MCKIVGRLFWVLGILAIIFTMVFYFTADQRRSKKARQVQQQFEEKLEAAERTTMEDLEKFLDGLEKSEKPEGRVGRSEQEGRDLAGTRKVKRDLKGEAIDLERFLKEEADTFSKEKGILAAGSTDLHQEVMWRIVGDWVYFRVSLSPFDADTDELMKNPDEAIFLCFNDSSGERVVPVSASARIPMRNFYRRWEDDEITGWSFSGKLSLAKSEPSALDHSRVGWIFSQGLHAHLRELKQLRADGGEVKSGEVTRR